MTFGDNTKRKVIGKCMISKDLHFCVENVLLVKGFKHDLLSISQFCDKRNKVTFNFTCCIVKNKNDKQVKLIGKRYNNIYMTDIDIEPIIDYKCLVSVNDYSWHWRERLIHTNIDLNEN